MTFAKLAVTLLLVAGIAASAGAEVPQAAKPTESTATAPEAADAAAAAEAAESAWSAEAQEPGESAKAQESAESAAADVAESAAARPAERADAAVTEERVVDLGPVGHDAQGRPGRIHVVQRGDTLWDVSDAYLGTPWVWPSIWKDNEAIKNPHLIHPGDHIWISPFEMRKVTAAEAAALLARGPARSADVPAALAETEAMPMPTQTFRYPSMANTGFVTLSQFEGASSIVESPQPRRWLSEHSEVVIGFGAGQVQVGDQFDIFRTESEVKDLDSGLTYGWATTELGWLEVTAVHEESATAIIRHSVSEMERGDHLLPRRIRPSEIPLTGSPGPVEGRIVHLPSQRMEIAQRDVVYLDRGARQGVALGNSLEIYRRLGDDGMAYDTAQKATRRVPDHVVAKLLVVDVFDDTSVALVMHTTEELTRGDMFRGSETTEP
jgi:hypothetical protein